jgi:CheY-like chemotaxis protein
VGHTAEFLTDPLLVSGTIERFKPHLLLLDIAMPGLDGWTIARTLREQHPPDALKLVAVTAYAAEGDRSKSRRAGFDAHVAKPIDPELIAHIIAQCFSHPLRISPAPRR